MGLFDATKSLAKQVADLFEKLVKLDGRIEGVERDIDRLREDVRDKLSEFRADLRDIPRRLREDERGRQDEMDELRRRLAAVEGLAEAALRLALKDAIVQLGREHLAERGTLEGFDPNQALLNYLKEGTEGEERDRES